jgi:UDP-GlcNAc:undecaprenyl-phosphate GlcNAc-1-phosphate transferase
MGDVGSQFCGFMLSLLGIAATQDQYVTLSFLVVPLLLSGVLLDVAVTLVRRGAQARNVAQAHRGHLYQIAHRAGMDARWIALIYWGFSLFGGLSLLVFLSVGPVLKLVALAAPLVPFAVWAWWVRGLARRAGITDWG